MAGLTYADSGVDRKQREKAKSHLEELKSTYSLSKYGKIIETPFNTLYPISDNGKYHVKTTDGIGTKVLLSQLANKHDTIGIDAIAMVVNDCIRCGAEPIALTDAIDIKKSTPELLYELQKGLSDGARQSNCPIVGGEVADVPSLLNAEYHINCDCVGEVDKEKLIDGKKTGVGDVVIGLRSSGIHSNGLSLLRKALFTNWGGKYEAFAKPDGFDRELIFEALEPTTIYVKDTLMIMKEFDIHAAINITGDAYLKFLKMGHGFEFNNFSPQPIFDLIQKSGNVEEKEMFKTFNMGWGFALVVDKQDSEQVLNKLKNAETIGKVIANKEIVIQHKGKKLIL